MKRGFSVLAMALCVSGFSLFKEEKPPFDYALCTKKIHTSPMEALNYLKDYASLDEGLPLRHCRAMANYALHQFKDASRDLAFLAKATQDHKNQLWFRVKKQLAQSLFYQGRRKDALAEIAEAIAAAQNTNAPELSPLLKLRAGFHQSLGEYLKALQDLDHALHIDGAAETRLQRAELFVLMGQKKAAVKELNEILRFDSQNQKALAMREKLTTSAFNSL